MSSTVSTTVGDMVVVTHVLPANTNVNAGENTQTLVGVQKFIKGQPLALGTVQIIIGLMIFLFGIAMTPRADTLGVVSGIFVWGAAFYITAGSLTVAAARRPSRCLVNCTLAFSVVAAVATSFGIILFTLDATGLLMYCRYDLVFECGLYRSRVMGFSGVLAVFSLLELIVSATVAGYACSATCNCGGETPSIIVVPAESLATGQTAAPYTEEMQNMKGDVSAMTPPPAYSAVVS
ncbi:membrane-spanning 4-domains subfamily A member 4A-like [Solea solea]|uniref:membrane-spanning 4-domains subfamily A member 4A-like n=1 Tax=Solea solea TaxID=90069 RepID=UPI00272AE60B|nr:membrane-spanning 4-domains subfamily A member 4A-like [Solea solea]